MGTVYCPLQNNDGPAEEFMDNNNRNNPNNGNKNDKKPTRYEERPCGYYHRKVKTGRRAAKYPRNFFA